MAWGVETRVPFLDKNFLSVAMSINPEEKMIEKLKGRIEKYILRKAFDNRKKPYLPNDILWRQKEQFSDGVGSLWIDSIKEYSEKQVSDICMNCASIKYPINTPTTKEGYFYRELFEEHFPGDSSALTVMGGPSIACSTPAAIEWNSKWKGIADPSGRSIKDVYEF